MLDVLDVLKLKKPVLVAHSLGGERARFCGLSPSLIVSPDWYILMPVTNMLSINGKTVTPEVIGQP